MPNWRSNVLPEASPLYASRLDHGLACAIRPRVGLRRAVSWREFVQSQQATAIRQLNKTALHFNRQKTEMQAPASIVHATASPCASGSESLGPASGVSHAAWDTLRESRHAWRAAAIRP